MKKFLSLLLLAVLSLGLFAACGDKDKTESSASESAQIETVDYVSALALDMNSTDTVKLEVTVKLFIDGDTTHFNVPDAVSVTGNGILKARYLAINTPESTGKIEEWGKTAANFTKEKLQTAESIVLETDGNKWELDSTGSRHLVWVWYKPQGSDTYRNLNLEILQNGLALPSDSEGNRYGEICGKALQQAEALKLHVYSDEIDPNFYYGDATPMDLKELRMNIESYEGQKVAFDGVITYLSDGGAYVESYDEETGIYYGIYVYYGFSLNPFAKEFILPQNKVRIVGTVSYFEGGDSWQVSGLEYNLRNPNDLNSTNLLDAENKYPAAHVETTAETFFGKVAIQKEDEKEPTSYDYAALAMQSSIEMKNLKVKSMYTTQNEGSDSNGAISITCEVDGKTIVVRTAVLKDADGKIVTEDMFEGKTIDVKGVIEYYMGTYQINVFNLEDITIR